MKDPRTWPEEIRWIRTEFVNNWREWVAKDRSLVHKAVETVDEALVASPRFFVGRAGHILQSAPGKAGWQKYVQPLLNDLLGNA